MYKILSVLNCIEIHLMVLAFLTIRYAFNRPTKQCSKIFNQDDLGKVNLSVNGKSKSTPQISVADEDSRCFICKFKYKSQ